MAGAISQDWESCQFPFVLDEKATVVAGGAAESGRERRERFFIAPLGRSQSELWHCSSGVPRPSLADYVTLRRRAEGAPDEPQSLSQRVDARGRPRVASSRAEAHVVITPAARHASHGAFGVRAGPMPVI